MEKEYQKIGNVFKFDAKYKTIVGLNEPYETLKNIIWSGTEKIDGTNTRVYWDGHRISWAGHTDTSEMQPNVSKYMEETFGTQEMEYLFEQAFGEKEVYIFGEAFGGGIQKGGGLYVADGKAVGFIVFDINISGFDLRRQDVTDVAAQLGLPAVPVCFEGTLDEAKAFVASHPMSTLNGGLHEMEGLVLQPRDIQLYDSKHKLIKCKCKYRDMLKAGLAKE